MITLDVNYVDRWEESQHPRGTGKKGGQFVSKGEGGSGSPPDAVQRSKAPTGASEAGKTPIGAFVAAELAKGTLPETIAQKLKAVTALHKNPQYINRMFRQLEKQHNLPPGALGKAGGKSAPTPKSTPPQESKPPAPPPVQHSVASKEAIAKLANKTQLPKEKEYHLAAWDNATDEFIKAAQRVSINSVYDNKKKGAHYNPGNHIINMPYDEVNEKTAAVWRHEYGHAMDYGGKWQNQSYAYHDTAMAEGKALVENYSKKESTAIESHSVKTKAVEKAGLKWSDVQAFSEGSDLPITIVDHVLGAIHHGTIGRNITKHARNARDSASLHDFLGAITKNKMGWGHTNKYYKEAPRRHTSEAFANYVALTQGPGGKVYKAMLHAIAPKTCAGFAKIITDMAS